MDDFVFHHVGIAVRDLASASDSMQKLFGYHVSSGPFDDPVQRVSVCFLTRGGDDTVLELVAPLGPDSPITRTLEKGGGTYHVCYEVADINAAVEHMKAEGGLVLSDPVPAVAFEMRQIAWLMTPARLLVELVQGR
jgi:methylmalonyl-CoA/ethylmalonyl-CoA epimerase